jgi:cell division protein FtsW (lipid II flippase)
MSRRFLSKKNKSVIMYVLIVLAFILLAWGVFLFFKLRIKMMDKENGQAFHVTNQFIWNALGFGE